jgi:hypothetical protein
VEEDEEWHHTFGLLQLQGNLIDTVGATIQLGCSLSLSLALSLVLDGDWSTEYYSTPERGELIRINISMRLLITSSQPHQGLRLINSGRSLFTSKKKEWADYKTEAGPAAARPSYRHKFRSFLFLLLSIYVTSDLHQTCWFAANVVAVRYVAGEVVLSKIDLCGATLATSTSDLTRTIRKKTIPYVHQSMHACKRARALP